MHNLAEMPLSLRFYVGGQNSLRGFQYKSVGPGKYLKFASIQWQHRLTGNLYSALFYEGGTASNNINTHLQRSRGVGLIWMSPIGPIEADFAQALTKRGKPFTFLFSIGPAL